MTTSCPVLHCYHLLVVRSDVPLLVSSRVPAVPMAMLGFSYAMVVGLDSLEQLVVGQIINWIVARVRTGDVTG